MADLRRCNLCDTVRTADRIALHVYMRHRDWWESRFGPRPPAITVQVNHG